VDTRVARIALRLAFVAEFAALLLFGPLAMTIVATLAAVADGLADSSGSHRTRGLLVNVATAIMATQGAGFAYAMLSGTPDAFTTWPLHAIPLAAAVVAYGFLKAMPANFVVPFCTGTPIDRSWMIRALGECQHYVVGASIAAALAELVDGHRWAVLAVVAVPLCFAGRAYGDYVEWLDGKRRRRQAMESLDYGVCAVDNDCRVTLWNAAMATLANRPPDVAVGRPLLDVVPALSKTDVPRAMNEILGRGDRAPNAAPNLEVSAAIGARTLRVRVVPDVGGATLLWHDTTEETGAERRLIRNAERFALTAQGANDGLWELDLRTKEFYASARWRAMLGLPPSEDSGPRGDWFNRVHPDDLVSLNEALDAHLKGQTAHFQHEHRLRHEDGTYQRFLCRGVAVYGPSGRPARVAGSLTDLHGPIAQERIRSMQYTDPLTGLCNRTVFVEGLGRRLADYRQRRGGMFASMYLDLDRFKVVNDSLGHLVGDELITLVSRRLESCLRPGDVLARLGGDEFAILLNDLDDPIQANAIAMRVQDALSLPFAIGVHQVFSSASIGIAFSREEYTNPEEIMRDADTAMYHAKAKGRARHELFDADMHARALERLGLESDLRSAVKSQAFEVHYQPIVSLASRTCTGFEALIRWKRNGKAVSPAHFIPVAEELGLIESLGEWVLKEACRTFADWQRRFPAAGLECITVNVSTRQLMQRGFVQLVESVVRDSGLNPPDLRLEITETALMDGPVLAAQVLRDLRQYGVKIYLDDFGTGYSSLSHLHTLPVDALKIDRSFVTSLMVPGRPAIVESILALARTLHTSVVAEGVETDWQARELERLGCLRAQGYFFSVPIPGSSVPDLLVARRPLGAAPATAGAHPHPLHSTVAESLPLSRTVVAAR
jgi:diguanylate cyclase (GGDEF)-like protein